MKGSGRMHILHLEDNREDAELVASLISEEWPDCRIDLIDHLPEFLTAIAQRQYDVILSDFTMVSFNGLQALEACRQRIPDTPFIFISGTIGEERAIEAVRSGAADYVLKDRMRRLTTAIKRALEESQERRHRRAAEEARQRFVAILENTPDVVAMAAPDGQLLYLNNAGYRLLGLRPDFDITRMKLGDLHPVDIAQFITDTAIHEAVRDGTWTGETSLVTRLGSRIPVSQVLIAHKDSDGRVEYLSAILRDLSGSKRAEYRIREQAEILNKAREAIIIVGLDDRISYWNEGAERTFGWRAPDMLGKRCQEVSPDTDQARIEELHQSIAERGEWSGELRLTRSDGRSIIVETRATLVLDDAGRPRARLNILTDITAKKEMEEKLFRAQRIESIGMLAAGIAHDLNNVLAPIIMAAPMLRERATHPTDIKMIEALEKSANRGAGMVRQILGFAHGTGGEHRLVQVKHLIRDIATVITQTFPKDIRLEMDVASELSPVMGNPTQIHQVLLNLCVNARDAMPDGGTLTIQASNVTLPTRGAEGMEAVRRGNYVQLEVRDSGTGIPPEILARIWEPFFTTKESGKGTGLGLSTVRGITDNHGGFLDLKSAVGSGTSFRVFLPAADVGAVKAVSDAPHPRSGRPSGDGALILVVDDEPGVRDLATAILSRHGYRVVSAGDGIEALTIFSARAAEIALVISDINMPNLDGTKMIHALREIRPDVRILAVSGLDPSRQSRKEIPAASGFLGKPFTIDALLEQVSRLLKMPASS